jgi:hypothetical protein
MPSRTQIRHDPKEIARAIAVMFVPDDVIEMRVPKTEREGTVSGYFRDQAALVKAAASRNGDVGIYLTLNPVKPALLARCANRVRPRARTTTSDKDIEMRRWLLIDCDPVRPADISSSDEEHEAALERAVDIRIALAEEGWPAPVFADSGNGAHLLYRIDLPNDAPSGWLIEGVLKALSKRFSDAAVKIDEAVFNAARICKVYGTMVRKGDDLPERPHRLSRILHAPTAPEPVSRELLEAMLQPGAILNGADANETRVQTTSASRASRVPFSVEKWIGDVHLVVRPPVAHDGGRKWLLEECPFNAEHKAPDAAIFEGTDGRPGFKCLHDSCAGYHWKELRERIEGPRVRSQHVELPDTDEEEREDNRLPAFPSVAWRGTFAVYRRAADGSTEASDVAHFATLWAAFASTLGRRVRMYSGISVFPNVYLCYYGPSSDKKTTAQRRIQTLLGEKHGIALLSSAGSVQGMADLMAQAESGISLMLSEELSSLYKEGHADFSTLLDFFTEIFDCPDQWEKLYRGKPVALVKPTPSIFGCSTPAWFWKHATPDDFAGGFSNRFLYLTGEKKKPIPEPEQPDAHEITEVRNALQKLRDLKPVEARWSAGAKEEWNRFYISFDSEERAPLLAEAVKRCPVYVRKLAMVYAADEGTLPEITAAQAKAAIAVINYCVDVTERLMDLKSSGGRLHSNGELERRMLAWLKKRGEVKVRDLQQTMSKYCDAESFNRVLRSLEFANRIETTWDKTGVHPRRFVCVING